MCLKYLVVILRNRSTAWANGCRRQPDTRPIPYMQHFQPSRENPTAVKDEEGRKHIAGSIGTAWITTVTSSNVILTRTCGSASLFKFHCQFFIDYVFSPPLLMIRGCLLLYFTVAESFFASSDYSSRHGMHWNAFQSVIGLFPLLWSFL